MFEKIQKRFKKVQTKLVNALSAREQILKLTDLLLNDMSVHLAKTHTNPFNKYGKKIFSQTDEDGITFEIIRRIGIENGTFAEYGVGDGLENNTLALIALGWRGLWIGSGDLAFEPPTKNKIPTLVYLKSWITRDNIVSLTKQCLRTFNDFEIDVISLDLDGNDIYFVEELLQNGFLPKLFIVEYNSKFAPPIKWSIKYDPDFINIGDDYYGASLMSFSELFIKFDYFLVCCNSHSGNNAFFVAGRYKHLFNEVPEDIRLIYSPPRIFLPRDFGYRCSPKTIESFFKDMDKD